MESVRYMISDAANIVNVESHVLRYWEEELELNIPRNEMGHRYYTEENIRLFQHIKELKEQGVQLKAIKMLIPDLEKGEMEYMKTHSELGGATFHKIRKNFQDNEFLKIAEHMALYHHERWDGNGYPMGLKGMDIPLEARIMSIVDVYDALTSKRPYKEPFSHEKAYAIIKEGRGTQFDPDLVDEFMRLGDVMKDRLEHKEELREAMAKN